MDITSVFASAFLAGWLPILVPVLIFVSFVFGLWIGALHDFPVIPAISCFIAGKLTSSDFPFVLFKGFLFPAFIGILLSYGSKRLIRQVLRFI